MGIRNVRLTSRQRLRRSNSLPLMGIRNACLLVVSVSRGSSLPLMGIRNQSGILVRDVKVKNSLPLMGIRNPLQAQDADAAQAMYSLPLMGIRNLLGRARSKPPSFRRLTTPYGDQKRRKCYDDPCRCLHSLPLMGIRNAPRMASVLACCTRLTTPHGDQKPSNPRASFI